MFMSTLIMVNNNTDCTDCPSMYLKNIINSTVISVDQIGVVPWCIIWWFIWFVIHTVYKKAFQALLRRISIEEEHTKQLIRLYWNIAFTSLTVPFAMQNLKLDYSDVTDKFYYVLENHISKWFLFDPSVTVQTKLSYVILAGFYLNNISEVCFEFGIHSKEFIMSELIGLFFISTFPLRCVQFGLAVTTVINVVDFSLSLSKMFSCFCDIAQTNSLRVIVYIFLFFHSTLWFLTYLNLLPRYFMYLSLKKMGQASDVQQISMFLLLNCTLLLYCIFALVTSPITVMTLNFVRGKVVNIFTKETITEEANEVVMAENEENEESSRRLKKKENLLILYHTVKCVIRLKRKLKRIRKNKKTDTPVNCDDFNSSEDVSKLLDEEIENDYGYSLENTEGTYNETDKECSQELQLSDNEVNSLDDDLNEDSHLAKESIEVELMT